MGITNGNAEPDKRSYTPFSEADRIQMLGTTSEDIDKQSVLFDENKVSPEELRQIVGKDVDLIPAAEKLSRLKSKPFPDIYDPKPTSAPDIYIDPKPKASITTYHKDNIPQPVDESQIDEDLQNYADRDFDG